MNKLTNKGNTVCAFYNVCKAPICECDEKSLDLVGCVDVWSWDHMSCTILMNVESIIILFGEKLFSVSHTRSVLKETWKIISVEKLSSISEQNFLFTDLAFRPVSPVWQTFKKDFLGKWLLE